MKKIAGLQEIVSEYDLYIIDLWGVVHNGFKAFDHSIKAS